MSITLEEAKNTGRCRHCEKVLIEDKSALPAGWRDSFKQMCFPVAVILEYGREFSCIDCHDIAASIN